MECLTINEYISGDNLLQIIQCSPRLHTLIVKASINIVRDNLKQKTVFAQITSLTLEKFNASIDLIQAFLSLTPSLTYLKLIGHVSEFDGKRWEEFLQGNLPHLNKFEFDFESSVNPREYQRN